MVHISGFKVHTEWATGVCTALVFAGVAIWQRRTVPLTDDRILPPNHNGRRWRRIRRTWNESWGEDAGL